jgi:hypothetical protein
LTMSGSFSAERTLRIGPSRRMLTDGSWQSMSTGSLTRSISPLAPEQLRLKPVASGQLFQWVRCGRINADDWDMADIPLGETTESYTVRIVNSMGATVRTAIVTVPEFNYSASQRLNDLGSMTVGFKFVVKQNCALPGLGMESELQII